MVASLAEW